jgi:hypothetical protein
MFSPTPWRFERVGQTDDTGIWFGNIVGADGKLVAESVFEDDALQIVAKVNGVSS